jgi:hypothetical protein
MSKVFIFVPQCEMEMPLLHLVEEVCLLYVIRSFSLPPSRIVRGLKWAEGESLGGWVAT